MQRFLVFIFILVSQSTFSQTAEDSVKAVVSGLFLAMKSSDGFGVKNSFADSAILQTIKYEPGGEVTILLQKVEGFSDLVSKAPAGALDEQIRFEMLKVDADLATVWTPYSFYYQGRFSHCGVNSFQLVRVKGKWKIQYLIDTRRKTSCL